MNRILGAVFALAILFIIWQQTQLQREIKKLHQTLATAIPAPPALTSKTEATHSRLDTLQQELIRLQEQLARANRPLPQSSSSQSSSQQSSPSTELSAKDTDGNEQRSFSPTIDSTLALGVLDDKAWERMEADVANMSKEENRAFWIQVFGGIERGELQVVPPEESAQ